ncbi:MAG: nucleotide exchange factor GrpE [Sulfurovum sp.]|nr:nucleotide exchange factor GrpE [Sulfurovum sp.]
MSEDKKNQEEILDEVEKVEIAETELVEDEVQEEVVEADPLAEALAEVAEYKDKYIRTHADFENIKRRLEKDKNNAVSYANESFAKDILAVMDSFENAISAMETSEESSEENSKILAQMKEGVEITFNQLKKVLEKNNIKEVSCEGEFDPEVHQAIMQVESEDHEVGDVVAVMQKGYTIKERILRPAMVSTCK